VLTVLASSQSESCTRRASLIVRTAWTSNRASQIRPPRTLVGANTLSVAADVDAVLVAGC
jgi:hypothetical protein